MPPIASFDAVSQLPHGCCERFTVAQSVEFLLKGGTMAVAQAVVQATLLLSQSDHLSGSAS